MVEKRRINVGANKGKMGKPAPQWVTDLQNGIYMVGDLVHLSKTSESNVKKIMAKYAKEIKYIVQPNGRASARYYWDHKHFLSLFYWEKDEK
ncbi:MAG: hypothetical protein V4591_01535 [Bdellovibrionota bacterium]